MCMRKKVVKKMKHQQKKTLFRFPMSLFVNKMMYANWSFKLKFYYVNRGILIN